MFLSEKMASFGKFLSCNISVKEFAFFLSEKFDKTRLWKDFVDRLPFVSISLIAHCTLVFFPFNVKNLHIRTKEIFNR